MKKTIPEIVKRVKELFYSVVERPGMTLEERRRRTVVLLLMLVAIPTLFIFGMLHFSQGNLVRSAALFLVGLVCVFSLISLRYHENASLVFRIIVGVLASYFLVLVVVGGPHGSRIFWMLLSPLLAFFLLARIEGLIWSLASFFLCLLFLSDPYSIFGTYPYATEIKARFLVAYGIIVLIAYITEAAREAYQRGMEEEQEKLQAEIGERKRVEDELEMHRLHLEELVKERTSELTDANRKLMSQMEERTRAEALLRESEERYRRAVEISFDGIAIHSEGKLLFVNKAGAELLGADSPEQIIGKDLMSFVHSDYKDIVSKRVAEVTGADTGAGLIEEKFIRLDGEEVDVEVAGAGIRYQDREAIQTVFRDISERKRAEKALRESEEKYRLLVENAKDAIFIVQDEVITFANPRTEELVGYTAEELAATPFVNFIHPDDREMVLERHMKRIRGEALPSTYSFTVVTRGGEELKVELNTVFINWEGRPATLNLLRDITSQKKMESRLLQAQKMESLGTLAGGIAHDFNNLMMAVQGNVSLMKLDLDAGHPFYDRLQNIEEQIRSGADLTKQLLGFARGGKFQVGPLEVNKIVKKSAEMFGRTKREIHIQGKYEKDAWAVEADAGQLEQVLVNLYVNAWQSMPGGGKLFLQTENVLLDEGYAQSHDAKAGKYVKISVSDTGTGMDRATRERIFDPFFTTKEMGRGTGLGLASTYGIIRNHGGIINVYSEKGHGTTFDIYLPASERDVIEKKVTSRPLMKGTGTVLLIDDEEMILEVGGEMLKRLGYKFLSAKSGSEALRVYRENRHDIDLVILDMVMPEMGGGDVYDRLREINPDVKVLLASGYSINGQAQEILDRGCNGFIQKPFNIRDLSENLQGIMGDA